MRRSEILFRVQVAVGSLKFMLMLHDGPEGRGGGEVPTNGPGTKHINSDATWGSYVIRWAQQVKEYALSESQMINIQAEDFEQKTLG